MACKRIALIGNNAGMETLCNFFCDKDEVCVAALIHSDKIGSRQTAERYAEKYGILRFRHPLRKDTEEYNAFLERLGELHLDLAICYSYDRILDTSFLDVFNGNIYNLHGAMLPHYRGQNVLNWVLINGETSTGMTLHRMDAGIDSGPIVYQKEIPIEFDDTAVTLKEKMNKDAEELLVMFLPDIVSGNIVTKEQSEGEATYFHKRHPEDGEFNWDWDPMDIYNLIRALVYPWPGAYYVEKGEKIVIDRFMSFEEVVKLQNMKKASVIKKN